MKIVIINQPIGNRGDESAHKGVVRALVRQYPDVKIEVIFLSRSWDAVEPMMVVHPNVSYHDISWKHSLKLNLFLKYALILHLEGVLAKIHPLIRRCIFFYDRADYILCAPGGICLGGFQNWSHLFMLELARIRKNKLIYYSRSFGPFSEKDFQSKVFKKRSISILRYVSFLSIRDTETMKIAKLCKLNYISSIDSAFLEVPVVNVSDFFSFTESSNYIVFIPNSLTWHYCYKNTEQSRIDNFYIELINQCKLFYPTSKIVMIPQLFGNGGGADYAYFLKLKNKMDDDSIMVLPGTIGSDGQQTIIRAARLVIGSRYHSIVFAINNAIPFIALNYEHKISGLLLTIGLQNRIINIQNIFENKECYVAAVRRFNILLQTTDDPRMALDAQDNAHRIACDCFNQLVRFLKNN